MPETSTPAAHRRGGGRRPAKPFAGRFVAAVAMLSLAAIPSAATAGGSTKKKDASPKGESCVSSSPDRFKPVSSAEIKATTACFKNLSDQLQQAYANFSTITSTCPDDLPSGPGPGITAVSTSWLNTVKLTVKAKKTYYEAGEEYYGSDKVKKSKRDDDVAAVKDVEAKIKKIGFDLKGSWEIFGQLGQAVSGSDCDSATALLGQLKSAADAVTADQVTLTESLKALDQVN